ncbi:VanZ family protein [Planococcus sp. N064]|uniref:VanZ family protein n=1 Tax=Planococcus liqunii TaxID=3058394 RepID=A0ABT8MN83_9BACL|nr:VanZ family protein [Planococcus sp. N064]MDN7226354.1 VanZ family protein [Planococcus sp. N064]
MAKHKKLSWIVVVLWMALIFSLSHQPASKSSEMSTGITEMIVVAAEQVVPGIAENFGQLEHIVRKNAHFFIYLILGVLAIHAFSKSGLRSFRGFGLSVVLCVLYAISDEFHQLFVDGRSGELRDVFIDSSGAIVGIAMYKITENLLKRNSQKAFEGKEVQG